MRLHTDRQTDTPTDANRFYNLSHAICYRYGTVKDDDGGSAALNCSLNNLPFCPLCSVLCAVWYKN